MIGAPCFCQQLANTTLSHLTMKCDKYQQRIGMKIEHSLKMGVSEEVWIGWVGWSVLGCTPRIRCSGAAPRPLEILSAQGSRKLFLDQQNNILKKQQNLHCWMMDKAESGFRCCDNVAVGQFPTTHDHSSPPVQYNSDGRCTELRFGESTGPDIPARIICPTCSWTKTQTWNWGKTKEK